MHIEAIGFVTLLVGILGWFVGPAFSVYAFILSNTLGATGAIILTSLGSANIQPPHLLLGFLALPLVANGGRLRLVTEALAFPKAGFWLLLATAFGALSAVFFPRLFAGATYVFTVARTTEAATGIIATPLAPTSGNITQSIYFIGDLLCFLLFCAYARKPELFKATVRAVFACAALNVVFAVLDVTTYLTSTSSLLSAIRNARYRMLNDASILGFKRIVGSFPEASAFAYFTLGPLAFCTRLWLANAHRRVAGTLALFSFIALIFSTSSTGYAGVLVLAAALWLCSTVRMLTRPVSRSTIAFFLFAPLLTAASVSAVRLYQPAWTVLQGMVAATVTDKLSSASGRERSEWNERALANFTDTDGLGAGIGSVRASSLPVAVLGNIGAIGAATYGSFLLAVLLGRRNRWTEPYPAICQSAARWACFAQLIGASVGASLPDVDLPFFVFAGLACAGPQPRHWMYRPMPAATGSIRYNPGERS